MKYLFARLNQLAVVGFLLLVSSAVFAQGSVSDDGWQFDIDGFASSPSGNFSVDLRRPDGTDNVFGMGFWYRLDGDTREIGLGVPDVQDYTGNTVTLTWNDVGGAGAVSAEATIVLNGGNNVNATLDTDLQITSLGSTSRTLDVFFYLDADFNGTIGGDTASLVSSPSAMLIEDGRFDLDYSANGADAYQVTSWPQLRNSLNDAGLTEMDNSGLPFGPGDFTGGFQFQDRALAPAATLAFGNFLQFTFDSMQFERPESVPVNNPVALIVLFGLVLLGAGMARRRQRV